MGVIRIIVIDEIYRRYSPSIEKPSYSISVIP